MNQQRGYILFITFSILALCVALVSAFMVKGMTHKRLMLALIEQEELEQLACSAPALAQSFLAFSAQDMKNLQEKQHEASNNSAEQSSEKEPSGAVTFEKMLLEKVLPVVNKTQKFILKDVDLDLPAQLDLTFFCESGKININGLYDLENKKFHNEGVPGKDQKVFVTWLFDRIAVLTEKPSLFGPFVEHLKQRKNPFNDVTQLLAIKEFATCFQDAVFYSSDPGEKRLDGKDSKKIYLTDIFTVSSEHDTIQPWLLSPSVCALLDIAQTSSKQMESEKKEDKKIDLSSFKLQTDWSKDWDLLLKPVYGISYDKIPQQVSMMFLTQFSVTVFSVLITVSKQVVKSENNRIVRVFAILKQRRLPDNSITYDVIKIYQV